MIKGAVMITKMIPMIIDGHHHCNLDHSDHLVLPWLGEAPSQETPRSGFTREGIQESSLNNSAQSHSQYWESKTESTQYVSIETIANESRYWDICKTKERVQWLNSSQQSFQKTFSILRHLQIKGKTPVWRIVQNPILILLQIKSKSPFSTIQKYQKSKLDSILFFRTLATQWKGSILNQSNVQKSHSRYWDFCQSKAIVQSQQYWRPIQIPLSILRHYSNSETRAKIDFCDATTGFVALARLRFFHSTCFLPGSRGKGTSLV